MTRIIILRLIDNYFRHRWLYLLPIFLLGILGVVYILTSERSYISSGVIFSEPTSLLSSLTSVQNEVYSWNTPAQDTANEISDLIRTDAFIRAVIQKTDLETEMSKGKAVVEETISEVRTHLWATTAGRSQVQINAANPDPTIAYQLSQATIDTYVQWKINLDSTDSATAGNFFQLLIEEYKSDVVKAQQALKIFLETHPEPVRGSRPDMEELEIQNLTAEVEFAGTRLAQAMNKAEDARLAEIQVDSNVRQKYTVVDAPDLPDKPAVSRRKLAMNAAVFLVAGFIMSGLAVVGATTLERSFRLPTDVQHELSLQVLALIPDVSTYPPKERFWKLKRLKTVKKEDAEPNEDEAAIVEEGEKIIDTSLLFELQELEVDFQPEQRVEK